VPNPSAKRQHKSLVALGDAIRDVRLSKGISQEKLALLAEVDRSYVGRVERGDNNVAVLTLARLAAALDLTIAKLMQKAGL
jgi:transcriptional regulator with XRE-family HTH domain